MNGKVVSQGKDCIPRKGYLCIESEGGIVHYRNGRIKELPDTPIDPEHIAIESRGFRCLYTGVDFAGWQKQPDEKLQTVQGCLEQALLKLTGQNCLTVGSGRTDAGTHARKQVVHFDIDKPADRYPWVKALNAHLPESIQAFEAFEAPDEFHALLSCQSKTYD